MGGAPDSLHWFLADEAALCTVQVIMQRLACENADLTAEVRRLHEERNDSDGEQLEELQAEVQRLRNENVRLRIAMAPRGVSSTWIQTQAACSGQPWSWYWACI